jgi:hypothetical protein
MSGDVPSPVVMGMVMIDGRAWQGRSGNNKAPGFPGLIRSMVLQVRLMDRRTSGQPVLDLKIESLKDLFSDDPEILRHFIERTTQHFYIKR